MSGLAAALKGRMRAYVFAASHVCVCVCVSKRDIFNRRSNAGSYAKKRSTIIKVIIRTTTTITLTATTFIRLALWHA